MPVFETHYGKVGLIICWDLMFPEIFRSMVQQGVELVICPSTGVMRDAGAGMTHDANSEGQVVNALCVARAFENKVILVYANAAGSRNIRRMLKKRSLGVRSVTVPFKGAVSC